MASGAAAPMPQAWPTGWEVIAPGGTSRSYFSISDGNPRNSVMGTCIGHVWIGQIVNRTFANWTTYPDRPCTMLALNPNDARHFIYTKPPLTYQSTDGGQTFESVASSKVR